MKDILVSAAQYLYTSYQSLSIDKYQVKVCQIENLYTKSDNDFFEFEKYTKGLLNSLIIINRKDLSIN